MKLIVLILSLAISLLSLGQTAFYHVFSNNGADFGNGIVQLQDSSYLITGSSSSFASAPSQAFILKLSKEGMFEWSKNFGGDESEEGRRVLYLDGVGYFVCGMTNSDSALGFDTWLSHFNLVGDLIWEKTFPLPGWQRVNDAILTQDSSIIMVGVMNSVDTTQKDLYMLCTNLNGDIKWNYTSGGINDDELNEIEELNDSTYIVCGKVFNEDSSSTKGYLMAINTQGNLYWEREVGNNGNYELKGITIRQNQIIGVGSKLLNNQDYDACYVYTDLLGNQQYEFTILGSGGEERFVGNTTFGDSSQVYFVQAYNNAWSMPEGTDLKITRSGIPYNPQFDYLIYHEGSDVLGEIIPTKDGGVIAVGSATEAFSGSNDILVIKIGPNDSVPAPDEFIFDLVQLIEIDEISIKLYPNPSSDYFVITGIDKGIVELMDQHGRLVLKQELFEGEKIFTSDLDQGIYFVSIEIANGSRGSTKLIVQH